VLDIGCGIGRLEAALAPCARAITGLDVSPAMIAEARTRHGVLDNVRFEISDGAELTGIDDHSIDLVTLVDTFPYLFLSENDLPERQVLEAARVLRRGGSLLILNVSYRGDPEADRTDLQRLAGRAGLNMMRWEPRPFSIWDAPAVQLTKG
jgi:ubiquinone/menaquinone biosynthesis C-methylase UbiE